VTIPIPGLARLSRRNRRPVQRDLLFEDPGRVEDDYYRFAQRRQD
jgi:hypothetical protein